METVETVTATNGSTVLEEETLRRFEERLHGPLLRQGDEGFDAACRVWNAMIDRRPALITRCTGMADVIAAIQFASVHDLLVSVRSGGHNISGSAVCDGGLKASIPRRSLR